MEATVYLHLTAAWIAFLVGAAGGAALGLFFHRESWWGGYGSFPRRLARLAHIACFGLGILQIAFAVTVGMVPLAEGPTRIASIALLIALITMPLCCTMTAWQPKLRQLFFVPVAALTISIVGVLLAIRTSGTAPNDISHARGAGTASIVDRDIA